MRNISFYQSYIFKNAQFSHERAAFLTSMRCVIKIKLFFVLKQLKAPLDTVNNVHFTFTPSNKRSSSPIVLARVGIELDADGSDEQEIKLVWN